MTPMQHTPSHAAMPKRSRQQRPPGRGRHGSPSAGYVTERRPGKFRVHPTGTGQDATLDVMDHQGAGRTRPTADTRRRPPWPSPDGPAYAYPGDSAFEGDSAFAERATGPLPLRSPGSSGTQPVLAAGSGAHRVLDPGSGSHPALGPAGSPGSPGRTPARGFPPARDQAEAPTGSFSPWHTPADGFAVQD